MRAGIVGFTIVLSAFALGACGSDGGADKAGASSSSSSGSSGKAASPTSLVVDTFSSSRPVTSGRLDLKLKLVANGVKSLNGPVAVRLSGPFASGKKGALPKLDLALALDAGAMKIDAGLVTTGGRVWIRYGGDAYLLPATEVKQFKDLYDKAGKQSGGSDAKTSLSSLGINPRTWITNTRIVGDEKVGADDTTHVRSDIDVAKLLVDVNTAIGKAGSLTNGVTLPQGVPKPSTSGSTLSARDRRDIERAITTATLDVWTGKDDHVLRRLRVLVAFDVPAALRARAEGLTDGSLAFDVAVTELNEAQSIAAPANARPFSELQPLLSGVLGA